MSETTNFTWNKIVFYFLVAIVCSTLLFEITSFRTELLAPIFESRIEAEPSRKLKESKVVHREKELSFDSPWAYQCSAGKCVRVLKTAVQEDFISLDTCKLICGPAATLWPIPTGDVELGRQVAFVERKNVIFRKLATPCPEVDGLVEQMVAIFHGYLETMETDGLGINGTYGMPTSHQLLLDIHVTTCSKRITLQTNESYSLWLTTEGTSSTATIAAMTAFGARHALETLSQLISWDYTFGALILLTNATIVDSPSYPHRGVMVDAARNFISFDKLLHIVDGLSHDKMNTLHLHISDANSFPFDSKRVPQMAKYGAYSSRKVYTFDDFKYLKDYANVRGVRVIPEIDAPAHAGNGWQWGKSYGLGDLALCVNESPSAHWSCYDPPCGILNPVNSYVYDVLESIYLDLMESLDPDVFHMGGDEVRFNCWNKTNGVVEWMTANGFSRAPEDFFRLWGLFQNLSLQRVDNVFGSDTPVVLWSSSLTDQLTVNDLIDPRRYVVQFWSGSRDYAIPRLYYKGFNLIFSNVDAWYLDCGYGSWVSDGLNSCAPYKSWQVMYDNNLDDLMKSFGITPDPGRILGGEAPMWSEQVDDATIDGKIWPRASAVAERLWSNPPGRWRSAERRFVHHRERMLIRKIMGDPVQPLWCHQNEGLCYS